ncbi:hypothetical protein V7150_24290, partial [Neobacillus drentensis]|uniref:hypothetical protein n=1 Tax=Neobacillus drentensis TaxID=220684 RepID=UPI003000B903
DLDLILNLAFILHLDHILNQFLYYTVPLLTVGPMIINGIQFEKYYKKYARGKGVILSKEILI